MKINRLLMLSALVLSPPVLAVDSVIWTDPVGDAALRRTDSGNDAPLPPGYTPIDLISLEIGGWDPNAPSTDLYTGHHESDQPDFVRIDAVFAGLVSPPGPIGINGHPYNPYFFGDRPVMGFFEFDIDGQKNSGGELMPIAQHRYLSNVARFGKSPYGSINERVAQSHEDIDTSFHSEPQFERSGAEFSITMCGCFVPSIISQDGNSDSIFDTGETWIVEGRFFERFQSFQPESAFFGGSEFGLFDPLVQLLFVHDPIEDTTTMSLVFPLTNHGAALAAGEPDQPLDLSLLNHTSLEEALDDLIIGADFATGSLRTLTEEWRDQNPSDDQEPHYWGVTALIGTAPTIQDPTALYIWTDTGFDELVADYNLDELNTAADDQMLFDFIENTDGIGFDSDLTVNGIITLADPGSEFHFFDLNNDGLIDTGDAPPTVCDADMNADGALDFFDVSAFLSSFQVQDPVADMNADGSFDFFDVSAFLSLFAQGCP